MKAFGLLRRLHIITRVQQKNFDSINENQTKIKTFLEMHNNNKKFPEAIPGVVMFRKLIKLQERDNQM